MLIKENFISTTELQQNVSKTIDKVKKEDIVIIRNNKLEAVIISIEKYNEMLQLLEWKKNLEILDKYPVEELGEEEMRRISKKVSDSKKEELFSMEDIEKIAEDGEDYE